MSYSNRELGDLNNMRKRNRQGNLIVWLNKASDSDIVNLELAQQKAEITTNKTLKNYIDTIINNKDLQSIYELSDRGLNQALFLQHVLTQVLKKQKA